MSRILLSFVACFAVPYFSKLSHKRHIFEKKMLNLKCVFSFSRQLFSETFLIPTRFERNVDINAYMSSCGIPVILVRFL